MKFSPDKWSLIENECQDEWNENKEKWKQIKK